MADMPPLLAQGRAPAYRATTALPLSFQAESGERRLPLALRRSLVPPTPVISGSEARPVNDTLGAEHAAGPRGAGNPEIVGGGQHRDVVPFRADVGVAQAQDGGPAREVLLWDAEALGDDVAQVVRDHVVLGRHELREAAARERLGHRRLNQQDAGPGCYGVGCLHVGGGLGRRVRHVLVARVVARHLTHGLQHPQRRRSRQAGALVEDAQVVADRGGPERVHDDDRPAPAVQAAGVQRRQVISPLDLPR